MKIGKAPYIDERIRAQLRIALEIDERNERCAQDSNQRVASLVRQLLGLDDDSADAVDHAIFRATGGWYEGDYEGLDAEEDDDDDEPLPPRKPPSFEDD